MTINWYHRPFNDLTPLELYRIMQTRSLVFHLEQQCLYLDADNKDVFCTHFMGWAGDELAAYCRLVPAGLAFQEASLGRVVTSPHFRKIGAGRELIKKAIPLIYDIYGKQPIRIGAQLYLLDFYSSLGFVRQGPVYQEDNIDHVEMLLTVNNLE